MAETMFDSDVFQLRLVRVFALVVALVAIAVLVFDYGTAAGGASILEELLDNGQRPAWYWTRMETSGYKVTAVSYARDHYLEYQVVKGLESYGVQLQVDADTGTVSSVNVVALGQEAVVQR